MGRINIRNCISLRSLAKELKTDRTSLRRIAKKQGIEFIQLRTQETQGQLTNFLTKKDADSLRRLRKNQSIQDNSKGWFYAIRLIPELDASRIKLGFTTDINSRLSQYRTSCPKATLVGTWPCKQTWERTAMDSITRAGCVSLGGEVFQCDDLDALIRRCEEFFDMM